MIRKRETHLSPNGKVILPIDPSIIVCLEAVSCLNAVSTIVMGVYAKRAWDMVLLMKLLIIIFVRLSLRGRFPARLETSGHAF